MEIVKTYTLQDGEGNNNKQRQSSEQFPGYLLSQYKFKKITGIKIALENIAYSSCQLISVTLLFLLNIEFLVYTYVKVKDQNQNTLLSVILFALKRERTPRRHEPLLCRNKPSRFVRQTKLPPCSKSLSMQLASLRYIVNEPLLHRIQFPWF